ncbi:protein kinase [Candidatus Daviesbacteria bacterium]|nr:protein kinase [Candidatus Daviesbacteria bacterium]
MNGQPTENPVSVQDIESHPGKINTPEIPSRQQVKNALRFGLTKIEGLLNNPSLLADPNQTGKINKARHAYEAIQGAFAPHPDSSNQPDPKNKADIAKGGFSFTNNFTDPQTGQAFSQSEGVPIDGLLELLNEEALFTTNKNERKKIQNAIKVLKASSKAYKEVHPDAHDESSPQFKARLQQEAYFAYQDSRKRGEPDKDWLEVAKPALEARRELVDPDTLQPVKQPAAPSPAPAASAPGGAPAAAPAPVDTPGRPGVEPSPSSQPEQREVEINITRNTDVIEKVLHLDAQKEVEKFLKFKGWRDIWRIPSMIGVRLGRGGAVNLMYEKMRKSFFDGSPVRGLSQEAAQRLNDLRHSTDAQQQAVLGRLKANQTLNGEQIITLDKNTPEQNDLRGKIIKDILTPIVTGNVPQNEAEIRQRKEDVRRQLTQFVQNNMDNPLIRQLFGNQAESFGQIADYFATDLLEMGLKLKDNLAKHQEGADQIDAYVTIRLANARFAGNTENLTATDKTVAWARRRRAESLVKGGDSLLAGTILNPLFVGAAVSLGADGLLKAANGGVRIGAVVGGTALAGPLGGLILGAVAGGGVVGLRRLGEVAHQQKMHAAEVALGGTVPDMQANGGLWGRLRGTERRRDMERSRYQTFSAKQLLDGGGQNHLQAGVDQLLTLDLSNTTNQQEVARRMQEIRVRLIRGRREKSEYITYGKNYVLADQEVAQLVDAAARLEQKLRSQITDAAQLNTLLSEQFDVVDQEISDDKRAKNGAARNYRVRQAAGATIFASTLGFAGGLAVRGVQNMMDGRGFFETRWTPTRAPGLARDTFKQTFDNPKNYDLNNDLTLATNYGADNGHNAHFIDRATGQTIAGPPVRVTSEGSLVISGAEASLDPKIKNLVTDTGWTREIYDNPDFNIHQKIKNFASSPEQDLTFIHGSSIVDLNKDRGSVSIFLGNPDIKSPDNAWIVGHFDQEGALSFDPQDPANANVNWDSVQSRLKTEGWAIESKQFETPPGIRYEKSPDKIVDKDFFGFIREHKEIGEVDRARRDLWHDNDTIRRFADGRPAGSKDTGNIIGIDGKELQFHHRVKDGQVELDFSQMRSQLLPDGKRGVNWDFSIDSQYGRLAKDISQNGYRNFEILITPDHAADEARQVVVINAQTHPELMQGKLNLDANSPLTKALFNLDQNGNPIRNKWGNFQNVEFIEVAHVEKRPDGSMVRTILSTTVGPGEVQKIPTTIPGEAIPIPEPRPPHEGFKLTPPEAIKYIPPLPAEIPADKLWATPFAPYHPLPFEERLIPPGSLYGGRPREEILKILAKNRSKTLKQNPNAKLNSYQEAQMYFEKQNPAYYQEIKQLTGQIKEEPSVNLKAIVCIPVAGHQEGGNIYNSLANYLPQDASKDQYEILLFVNYPQTDKQGEPVKPDNTLSEIERFRKDHPDVPIRVVVKALPIKQANIGTIRKYLNDIALFRQYQRGPKAEDIILISNDADNKGIAPTYLSNFIQKFEQNPQVDGMLGQLDWDPEAYIKYPLLHIGTRLFQNLAVIGRHRSGRMPSSGANFAFRGSIYAAIGGYLPGSEGGEDIAIGWGIIEGRQDHKRVTFAGTRVSRLYTSARRAIAAIKDGIVPLDQWQKEFSAFDDEIRRMQLGEGENINYDDPAQLAKFKEGLETVINKTLDIYEHGERLGKDSEYYQRALRWSGIQYKVVNGNVVIINMDVLVRGLKHYQKIGVLLRDIKAGKGTPETLAELTRLEDEFQKELENLDITRKERELAEKAEADNALDQFNKENPVVIPTTTAPKYDLEKLKESTQIQEFGDYVVCLDKPLGSGQMGQIVAGYNKTTGQILSFKRVKKSEREYIAKANRYPDGVKDLETIIKAQTTSPTFGTFIDEIDNGDEIIKIYPLQNTDLEHYFATNRSLPPQQAIATTIKIAETIRELHNAGIVHLDIALSNILLGEQGIKIIDFDAGSIKGTGGKFRRGFVGGNRHIRPPELFRENPNVTLSCDTYELTVLLYKLMTGNFPFNVPRFKGESTQRLLEREYEAHTNGRFEIPANIPDSIKRIFIKGLDPEPRNRYQTTDQMLIDLSNAYNQLK